MFGKPEWFKKKTFGWGVTPISWQGWLYTGVWVTAIFLPFLFFLFARGPVESTVWLFAGIGALIWDVRAILNAMDQEERKGLFYIGEEDSDSKVATRNFDLQVRE